MSARDEHVPLHHANAEAIVALHKRLLRWKAEKIPADQLLHVTLATLEPIAADLTASIEAARERAALRKRVQDRLAERAGGTS